MSIFNLILIILFIIMLVRGLMKEEYKGGSQLWFNLLVGVAVLALTGSIDFARP